MKRFQTNPLAWMIGSSALVLFLCSSVRHELLQSNAFDLGYFDQALYLLSRGLPPVVSFWGYHFLGGHGDWILYPIALLYVIHPSVYWLFGIQSLALALGALPTWHLARQAGLTPKQAITLAWVYLLYPLVFNLNLFDFHPEVIALPLFLGAILAARAAKLGWFCGAIILILGCRDALSLTVAAMGAWLWLAEKKRIFGAIALGLGITWFWTVTQVVIPHFRPGGVESVPRYAYLGNSLTEILLNLVVQPQRVLSHLITGENAVYLVLLFLPIAWGLSLRYLAPLIAIVPTLAINLLSTSSAQKDLIHQYSLPALPFLIVAAIAALAAGKTLIRSPRAILIWSLVGFLALAKVEYFGGRYLSLLDNWQANREAMALIQTPGSVLTMARLAPHLGHRPIVKLAVKEAVGSDPTGFDYVLLDVRHPGVMGSLGMMTTWVQQLQQTPQFDLRYQRDEVYLFIKKNL
ncbi:MAG TPA: DUF2079 domain-containing protein [Thermosynechococcaceae cyanobacterium]